MARYVRVSSEAHGEHSKFEDMHPEEQRLLLEWVRQSFQPTGRHVINPHSTAYGLKACFGNSKFGFYVFSREFAEAMEKAGFQSVPCGRGNWRFNIDEAGVIAADRLGRKLKPVAFGTANPAVKEPSVLSG